MACLRLMAQRTHKSASLRVILGVVLLLVGGGWPLSAQDALEIGFDERYTLDLDGDAPLWVSFQAEAGTRVRLRAEADELDTVLEVLGPDGRRLAFADDHLNEDGSLNRNATLERLLLPQTGTYRVRVDSFNGVSAGAVTLHLERLPRPTAERETEGDALILRGTLRPGELLTTTWTPETDGPYVLRLRDLDGTLDPALWLSDADGDLLARQDDLLQPDGALNWFDVALEVEVNAGETLTVTVFDIWGERGAFVLRVQALSAP